MIDPKDEIRNFMPISFEKIAMINTNVTEDVKNSIMLYNSALENMKKNNEDIALIELKKAVSQNPEFYEAVNLLGLCYYSLKDYDKAREMFERVAKAENNGAKAVNYLNTINGAAQSISDKGNKNLKEVKRNEKKQTTKTVSKPVDFNPKRESKPELTSMGRSSSIDLGRRKNHKTNDVPKYLTGVIIGLLIAFLLSVSGFLPFEESAEPNDKVLDETVASENNEYKEKYVQLESEYEKLKNEAELAEKERDYYKAAIRLYEIEKLAKENKYGEAFEELVLIKNVEFQDDEKQKCENLFNEVMPRAADALYIDAYNLFQAQKYQESLEKYSKIKEYCDSYVKMDVVLYYMGKCYLELGDKENAKAMFLETIERFPNSEYAGYSKSKLNSL